jgi:hypothetical protein
VLVESPAVTDAAIREFLRMRCDIFPGMITVERRRELPYTASGKVDYQALARAMS